MLAAVAGTALFLWRSPTEAFALPKATFVAVAAVAIGALGVARAIVLRRVELPLGPVPLAMAAVLVAMTLASLTSSSPLISTVGSPRYTGLVLYWCYGLIAWATMRVFAARPPTPLLRTLLLVSAVIAGYALLQSIGVQPLPFGALVTPVFATLGNPNFVSAWLGLTAPVALWAALESSNQARWRVGASVLLIACLVGIVRTKSFQGAPTAFVGLVLVLGVWALGLNSIDRLRATAVFKKAKPFLVAAALAVGAGLVFVLPRVVSYASRAAGVGAAARLEYWAAARRMIEDHPWLGTGPGTFAQHYAAYYQPGGEVAYELADDPHSVPLAMLTSGGLVLGLAWLLLVVVTGWALVRGLRRTAGSQRFALAALGAAWLGYQAQSLVSIDIPPLALLHWVLAAAIAVGAGSVRFAAVPKGSVVVDEPAPRKGAARRRPVPLPTRTRVAVAVVTALGVALAWLAVQPMRASAAADRAEDFIEAGDAAGAVREARESTRLAPWNDRGWWLLGRAYERAEDMDRAIAAGRRAVELAPANAAYSLVLARLAFENRDFDEALRLNELAYHTNPRHIPAIRDLAKVTLVHARIEQTEQLLERGLELESAKPSPSGTVLAEFWAIRGRMYTITGRPQAADAAFERALELDPKNLSALNHQQRG